MARAALPVPWTTSGDVADSVVPDTIGVVSAPWLTTPTGANGAGEEGTGSAVIGRAGRAPRGPLGPPSELVIEPPLFSRSVVIEVSVDPRDGVVGPGLAGTGKSAAAPVAEFETTPPSVVETGLTTAAVLGTGRVAAPASRAEVRRRNPQRASPPTMPTATMSDRGSGTRTVS